MNASACHGIWTLALDVGGTKIAAGLVTPTGTVEAARTIRTPRERLGDPGLRATEALTAELLAEAELTRRRVTGIGLGLPEYVAADGTVLSREVIDWLEPPALQFARFGLPVHVTSDVRAAAAAEAVYGAGRDLLTFVYISVGTGISYCLVDDGRPRVGAHGAAIALGELVLPETADGQREYTLEHHASGGQLPARYHALAGTSVGSTRELVDVAERGDEVATALLHDAGSALGSGIAQLVLLLDPHGIVLGGSLGTNDSPYRDACLDRLHRRLAERRFTAPAIRVAALGPDAGIVGAAQDFVACEAAEPRVDAGP